MSLYLWASDAVAATHINKLPKRAPVSVAPISNQWRIQAKMQPSLQEERDGIFMQLF
jgi:hypothetical protein